MIWGRETYTRREVSAKIEVSWECEDESDESFAAEKVLFLQLEGTLDFLQVEKMSKGHSKRKCQHVTSKKL